MTTDNLRFLACLRRGRWNRKNLSGNETRKRQGEIPCRGPGQGADRRKPEADKPEPGQASQRLQEQKRAAGKPTGRQARPHREAADRGPRNAGAPEEEARSRSPATCSPAACARRSTRSRRTFLFLGRSFLGGLDRIKPLGGIIVSLLAGLAPRRSAAALAALAGPRRHGAQGARPGPARPRPGGHARRGLIVVALAAGALLIVSQFLDFQAIEIGQPGYVDVQEITRAPRQEAQTPIDHHSLVLVAGRRHRGARRRRRPRSPGSGSPGWSWSSPVPPPSAVALLVDLPAGARHGRRRTRLRRGQGRAALRLLARGRRRGRAARLRARPGPRLPRPASGPDRRQRRTVNSPATGSRA